jgi:hypothetical protein
MDIVIDKNKQVDSMVWMINVSKKHIYTIMHYQFIEKYMMLLT